MPIVSCPHAGGGPILPAMRHQHELEPGIDGWSSFGRFHPVQRLPRPTAAGIALEHLLKERSELRYAAAACETAMALLAPIGFALVLAGDASEATFLHFAGIAALGAAMLLSVRAGV